MMCALSVHNLLAGWLGEPTLPSILHRPSNWYCSVCTWYMQALRQHEVGDEDGVHQEAVREHKQLSGSCAL